MTRQQNRSFEVCFSVAFDEPDQGLTRIIYVRTIGFSDDKPPKIHVDLFIDLFELTIETFSSKPTKGIRTVHRLITYNASCFDDQVLSPETMTEVTFHPNIAPGSRHALATAYLKKTKTFAQIKDMSQGGAFPAH